MYKFKNVKKLLIEFSRGEGLSVPTDSIKIVKVDGDELSGATSGGSSSEVTVKSVMASVIGRNERLSECVIPDAYYVSDGYGNMSIVDNVEDLVFILVTGSVSSNLIPSYSSSSVPGPGIHTTAETYITDNWNTVSGSVLFAQVLENSEYYTASSGGII